jgi:hypothetical protein
VSTVTALLLIYMCVITSPMSVISVPVIVCVLHISRRRGVALDRAGQTAGTRELDAKIRRANVSWRFRTDAREGDARCKCQASKYYVAFPARVDSNGP